MENRHYGRQEKIAKLCPLVVLERGWDLVPKRRDWTSESLLCGSDVGRQCVC